MWLPVKNPQDIANCKRVKCESCKFGKASRQPTKNQTVIKDKSKEMELRKDDLVPGQWVSVDHFKSALPIWLYNSKGRNDDDDIFNGGWIFLDHASTYVQVWHQVTFSADDTVKDKLLYERNTANYGVCIQAYHNDNGVLKSKDFMDALIEKYQHTLFSGAGAAHQSGPSERGTQMVIQMACTTPINYTMNSNQCNITPELWPIAIDHTVWLYNLMPCKDSGMSTYEIWSRFSFIPIKEILYTCHTWGATTYVLEAKLQKGGSHIPKWAPHSHHGVFLGFSRLHSTMVGLIINLHNQYISPQFHIVFDEMFTTVVSKHNEEVLPKIWTNMITNYNAHLHI